MMKAVNPCKNGYAKKQKDNQQCFHGKGSRWITSMQGIKIQAGKETRFYLIVVILPSFPHATYTTHTAS
jgi:hypothetical protein